MKVGSNIVAFATCFVFASTSSVLAQDLAKLVTSVEFERATGAKFQDGWKPMPAQISFAEVDGNLQVSAISQRVVK